MDQPSKDDSARPELPKKGTGLGVFASNELE